MTNHKPFPLTEKKSQLWLVPLVLLFICLLSYALLIPWLGYYWDDWAGVWVSHSLGGAGLREYASLSRPFEGWVFTWATSLLGEAPLRWHVFAFLVRWLGAVAVWWSLRGLWPQRTAEVASIAFMFAVYPGFAVQPSAWIHSQGYLIPLALFAFSLGAMIWAIRVTKFYWPLTGLALLSSAMSMMVTEHFVGLELLRPVLLWVVLSGEIPGVRSRMRRIVTQWSPYLTVVGIFVAWRLFLFRTSVSFLDQSSYFKSIAADPLFALRSRFRKAIVDVIQTTLMAWGQTFRPDIFNFDSAGSRSLWIALGLVVISAAVVILYLRRAEPPSEAKTLDAADARWIRQAIVIGLIAVILGGLPIWFIGRRVNLDSDANRYSLAMMFGACIFLAGLIRLIIKSRFQQTVVVGLLVGLAVGFHFRNADLFRKQWLAQQSLYWQLSWRVPGLKPGTSILLDAPKSLFDPLDFFLAAPVNFIYAPRHSSPQLDYSAFVLSKDKDFGHDISQLVDGVPLKQSFFSLTFAGTTSESLVIWFSPPSCLRVLDPERDEIPQLPTLTRAAQHLSRLDRIITTPESAARPPAEIFGAPPAPCWCSYFEEADLARQMGKWHDVAKLGDEVRHLGLKPNDPTEWVIFVEGYSQVGRYADARQTAELALESIPAESGTNTARSGGQNEALLIRPVLYGLLKRLEDKNTGVPGASR
jgi:hypothetical protein